MKSHIRLYDVASAQLIESSDSLDNLQQIKDSWIFRDKGNAVVIAHMGSVRRFKFPWNEHVHTVEFAHDSKHILVSTDTRMCLWSLHQANFEASFWYFQLPELGRLCLSFPPQPSDSFQQRGGRYETNALISTDGTWSVLLVNGSYKVRIPLLVRVDFLRGFVTTIFQSQQEVFIGCMCLACNDTRLLARRVEFGGGQTLCVWDTCSGSLLKMYDFINNIGVIYDFGYYPLIFIGCYDGKIFLFNVENGIVLFEVMGINEPILSLKLSADHLRLIANDSCIFHLLWSYDFAT
jgi:WD40 repeat protein